MRGLWMTAVVAVLVAGACGADSASAPTPGAPAANAPATTPATTAPATGAPATPATPPPPQQASETLPLVGGGTFDAGRLDQGPLALWFWAPG